jgi:lipoprotein-anchoring transpeptidase ErfK/SrfK
MSRKSISYGVRRSGGPAIRHAVSVLSRGRLLVLGGAGAVVLVVAAGVIALHQGVAAPSARLDSDADALARIVVSGPGAKLASVELTGPQGARIPVSVRNGRVYPATQLPVGQKVVLTARISRPAPVSWVLGGTLRVQRTLRTPKARLESRFVELAPGATPTLSFAAHVARVSVRSGSHRTLHVLPAKERTLSLTGGVDRTGARTVLVSAAPRAWESLPAPVAVTWFAQGGATKVVASPRPGAVGLQPGAPLRLSFSRPLTDVLGARMPRLTPPVPGHWRRIDAHTVEFRPSGGGYGIDAKIAVVLPGPVQLAGRPRATTTLRWSGATGTTLRLQQLLAHLGYLPVIWQPAGAEVPLTLRAQQTAAIHAPKGHFTWSFTQAPQELRALWRPGFVTSVTQGAVMAFQAQHGLEVDGFAGPIFWHELIEANVHAKGNPDGYSYVLVRKRTPQSITVWHNGDVIVNGPSNTGIPKAPTPEGTFPVFQRLTSQTMTGTNPDGSRYSDAGIRWISYFHGNDAIHGFNRTSYGSPQSLGCVELPVSEAARVYPYTPIGTLVTIAP